MGHINRDALIAITLLVITGTFFWASFDIREPDYGQLSPAAWPRMILVVLGILSFLMLVQAIRQTPPAVDAPPVDAESTSLVSTLTSWRNPVFCFVAFLGFLLALPHLGMLVGGVLFVFVLLTLLGGVSPRLLLVHALIATGSIGAMWSLFTFGLRVILPTGSVFDGRI
ncbi:MAG: tripartite tricarboxylate transporter TctB family protein [Pseudomonadota bacterium]